MAEQSVMKYEDSDSVLADTRCALPDNNFEETTTTESTTINTCSRTQM